MPPAELPPNEPERLDELRRLGILDSDPERDYDDLTLLAAQICGTPMAMISLIDERRQWFKSRVGLSVTETSRDHAFCAYAIHDSSTMVVNDALTDRRFQDNPFVTGDPRVRFYAGVPLSLRRGLNLGTLCVLDSEPRELTDGQKAALEALGRQVVRNLQHRQFDYLVSSFLENAPLFFALKNHDGRYEFVSSAWRDALRRFGNPLGKTSAEWVGDAAAADADRLDHELTQNRGRDISTVDAFGLAGRTWITSRFPVKTLSGLPGLGIVGIDVTERLAMEARLRDSERQLEHARRVETIGMLASTIAHEFNNLLMGIGPHAEIIARLSGEDSRERRAAATIRDAVKRGTGLVQKILRYGRPTEPAFTRVNVAQWITEQIPITQALAGPDVVVEWQPPPEETTVMADVDQLHQVVANLVANARDAMNGQGRVEIRLSRHASEPLVVLSVSDHGPGIPAGNLQSIFEPLFTTKRIGTGLGLAVVKQIVEQHGGSVSAENNMGAGATFHASLPVAPPA